MTFLDETCVRQNVASQLTNGTLYEISAWMRKGASGSPYDVRLQLHVNSLGSGDQIFPTGQFYVNNSGFLLLKGTVKPQWSDTLLSAYWEATGISHIQDLYVDDADAAGQIQPASERQRELASGRRFPRLGPIGHLVPQLSRFDGMDDAAENSTAAGRPQSD